MPYQGFVRFYQYTPKNAKNIKKQRILSRLKALLTPN